MLDCFGLDAEAALVGGGADDEYEVAFWVDDGREIGVERGARDVVWF